MISRRSTSTCDRRSKLERQRPTHRLFGQRVEFPDTLPTETDADWHEIERLLYFLAVLFGVIEVPEVTVYGIWRGKDPLD